MGGRKGEDARAEELQNQEIRASLNPSKLREKADGHFPEMKTDRPRPAPPWEPLVAPLPRTSSSLTASSGRGRMSSLGSADTAPPPHLLYLREESARLQRGLGLEKEALRPGWAP